MPDLESLSQQNYISIPIISSSLIGILIFWALKQILEKKNIENTARILTDNFERTHDLQIKELKDGIKNLQSQIEAKIDIIEQKNVHINLINKEFHTLQRNYNRLKKESIFLKDQLHNAQLDIVEFEQENVNLVNQLNEALQHINSLDQIIESEKSTDQSNSKIEDDFHLHEGVVSNASEENFSEIIAAESTKNSIVRRPAANESAKAFFHEDTHGQQKAKAHYNDRKVAHSKQVYKSSFANRDDLYDDAASVTESDNNNTTTIIRAKHRKDNSSGSSQKRSSLASKKRDSLASGKETKQADFPDEYGNNDLDQPVEKKQVASGEVGFEDELRDFPSNIIYDENIITNANPPSPMKYDLKAHHHKGHSKTESSFSHKSGKSSKSNGSKVIINPDNGSEIMVQGPTNLKRNKSGGKNFNFFHFASKSNGNELNFNTPKEPIITNAGSSKRSSYIIDLDDAEEVKYKWLSELDYLRSKGLKSDTRKEFQTEYQNENVYYDDDDVEEEIEEDLHDHSFNEDGKKSNHSIDVPEKETKKDDESDVLMVDHQRGVIYSKDYNTSSNLIPKFSKAAKFSFKRRSHNRNSLDRRAFSSSV